MMVLIISDEAHEWIPLLFELAAVKLKTELLIKVKWMLLFWD